ncbi:MAG: tetratricopeptide repeat protein [Proteobacteria bacterium]|nr:tetratricopeptide repeat protein [Pseudomonadota bacterium]
MWLYILKRFNKTSFSILIICVLLFSVISGTSFANVVTIQKDYAYEAGDADSKISCRTIAIEQVKKILLEELGTYLETETEIANFQLTKDNIVVLTAGIVSVNVLKEEWDGFTYRLKAEVTADTDQVARSIDALRQDRQKIKELEETRKRADELLSEVDRLKKELELAKTEARQDEQKEYVEAVKQLGAIDSFDRGYSFSLSGNYDDAINAFSRATVMYPQFIAAYNNRGIVYAEKGYYQQALNDYDKVITINPKYAPAYHNRGIVYFNLGNYKQAVKDYDRAIKIDPKYAEAYSQRGMTYSYVGKYNKALKDFNKIIELNPSHVNAYRNRGDIYTKYGDRERATKDYNKAVELTSRPSGTGHTHKIQNQPQSVPVNPAGNAGQRGQYPGTAIQRGPYQSTSQTKRPHTQRTFRTVEIGRDSKPQHMRASPPARAPSSPRIVSAPRPGPSGSARTGSSAPARTKSGKTGGRK